MARVYQRWTAASPGTSTDPPTHSSGATNPVHDTWTDLDRRGREANRFDVHWRGEVRTGDDKDAPRFTDSWPRASDAITFLFQIN